MTFSEHTPSIHLPATVSDMQCMRAKTGNQAASMLEFIQAENLPSYPSKEYGLQCGFCRNKLFKAFDTEEVDVFQSTRGLTPKDATVNILRFLMARTFLQMRKDRERRSAVMMQPEEKLKKDFPEYGDFELYHAEYKIFKLSKQKQYEALELDLARTLLS